MTVPLIVPVLNRFDLFTDMMSTVDTSIRPYLIENWKGNMGVAASWNEGMRRAMDSGYRYAVITNDDVRFRPGALRRMMFTIKSTDAVMVSANQNSQHHPGQEYVWWGVDMFCFAVDIEQLVDRCGWFDENFTPAYFEDNDMAYRMKLAGVKYLIDPAAVVDHVGSATQFLNGKDNGVCSHFDFERNRAYYNYKWDAFGPGIESAEHPYGDEDLSFKEWTKFDRSVIFSGRRRG